VSSTSVISQSNPLSEPRLVISQSTPLSSSAANETPGALTAAVSSLVRWAACCAMPTRLAEAPSPSPGSGVAIQHLKVQVNGWQNFLSRRLYSIPAESGAEWMVTRSDAIPRGPQAVDVDTFAQLANELDYIRACVPIGEMFVQHALLHRRQRINILLRLISARHQSPSAI
jgi:hypothetical protein